MYGGGWGYGGWGVRDVLAGRSHARGESTGDSGNWGSMFPPETETCMTSCASTPWARGRMGSEYQGARDVCPCPTTLASQPFGEPWTAAQCVLASMDCDTVCERSKEFRGTFHSYRGVAIQMCKKFMCVMKANMTVHIRGCQIPWPTNIDLPSASGLGAPKKQSAVHKP